MNYVALLQDTYSELLPEQSFSTAFERYVQHYLQKESHAGKRDSMSTWQLQQGSTTERTGSLWSRPINQSVKIYIAPLQETYSEAFCLMNRTGSAVFISRCRTNILRIFSSLRLGNISPPIRE